jgi:hypothetical protein
MRIHINFNPYGAVTIALYVETSNPTMTKLWKIPLKCCGAFKTNEG